MNTKPMTKPELKRKAQVLVNLARTGDWTLIQAMLEAGFPEELAEFMLEKVRFIKSAVPPGKLESDVDWGKDSSGFCELDAAPWLSKVFKKSPRASCWSVGDEERAAVLALALVTLTDKKSPQRTAAARITHASLECIKGGDISLTPNQLLSLSQILSRGLRACRNLVRLHIVGDTRFLKALILPEGLKVLRVRQDEPLSTSEISRPSSLKAIELSSTKIILDESILTGKDKGRLRFRINPQRLEELGPGVAEHLIAENQDLNLKSLEKLKPEEAEVLSRCTGNLSFGHLKISKEVLQILSNHKSFKSGDKNRLWQSIISRYSGACLADNRFLILGDTLVLDYASGKTCLDLSGENKRFALEQGHVFTVNGASEVECVCLKDRKTVWKRKVKDANKVVFAGAVIVFGDYGTLSKLSMQDGSTVAGLSLGLSAGGARNYAGFTMSHFCHGEMMFLWSPKTKYTGGRWMAAVNLERFAVDWTINLPGIAGRRMVTDAQGRLVFAVVDKVLRLDPATGATIGKAIPLGGSWPEVRKCYPDGTIIAGCQKGYDTPQMKCFDDKGKILWNISLGGADCYMQNAGAAAFFKDFILMPFHRDNNTSIVWIIDRKTGKNVRKIEQENFDIGRWQEIACFDDRHILLRGESGSALYDGIPSSWI